MLVQVTWLCDDPEFRMFPLYTRQWYLSATDLTFRLPKKGGLVDWDCAESLSIPDIVKSLDHIHKNGTFPVSQQSLHRHANHRVAPHS
jgi:hypothetical protein